MAIEIKLPELGENIASGDIVNVLVNEGDTVAKDQSILEVQADKAVVNIVAPSAGKVSRIHVKSGDTVEVGKLVVTLDGEGNGAASKSPEKKADAPKAEAKPEPKAEANHAGPNNTAAKKEPAKDKESEPKKRDITPSKPGADVGSPVPAGPAARRLAREFNIDIKSLTGSGPRGRITPDDVISAVKSRQGTGASAGGAKVSAPAINVADFQKYGPIKAEKLSPIRRAIAQAMTVSTTVIPHVTNFDEADITELERIRKGVEPNQLGANVKLTSMPFVMKAVALALKSRPLLNSSLDEANNQIIYKQYVHIGVAVDTPRGLVVPVIRDVDKMTIPEIARSLSSVAERARDAKFTIEETKGGSFTISNLGAVGGRFSTPIINYPEAAILLLGRSRIVPTWIDDRVEPRLMFPLSLSYDHRLIDGAEAGRFLNEVIGYLQSPGKLLLAE